MDKQVGGRDGWFYLPFAQNPQIVNYTYVGPCFWKHRMYSITDVYFCHIPSNYLLTQNTNRQKPKQTHKIKVAAFRAQPKKKWSCVLRQNFFNIMAIHFLKGILLIHFLFKMFTNILASRFSIVKEVLYLPYLHKHMYNVQDYTNLLKKYLTPS